MKYKTIDELLGWANAVKPNNVFECGWRADTDYPDVHDNRVTFYERETAESDEVREDIGSCLYAEGARLMAAAPDLYHAATFAENYLEHSTLMGADKVRAMIRAAIEKAGGER